MSQKAYTLPLTVSFLFLAGSGGDIFSDMDAKTKERIRRFSIDRDYDQFHCPANLAKSIAIEAAELLECFQWDDAHYDVEAVKEELADVLVYAQNLIEKLGLDEDEIINAKMDKNEAKYPVAKAKGRSTKYDKL